MEEEEHMETADPRSCVKTAIKMEAALVKMTKIAHFWYCCCNNNINRTAGNSVFEHSKIELIYKEYLMTVQKLWGKSMVWYLLNILVKTISFCLEWFHLGGVLRNVVFLAHSVWRTLKNPVSSPVWPFWALNLVCAGYCLGTMRTVAVLPLSVRDKQLTSFCWFWCRCCMVMHSAYAPLCLLDCCCLLIVAFENLRPSSGKHLVSDISDVMWTYTVVECRL